MRRWLEGPGSLLGISSHKQIGLEVSVEDVDGGELSNVSWQVIPRLCT